MVHNVLGSSITLQINQHWSAFVISKKYIDRKKDYTDTKGTLIDALLLVFGQYSAENCDIAQYLKYKLQLLSNTSLHSISMYM